MYIYPIAIAICSYQGGGGYIEPLLDYRKARRFCDWRNLRPYLNGVTRAPGRHGRVDLCLHRGRSNAGESLLH